MPKVKRMGIFNIEFTVQRGELEYLRTDCGDSDETNEIRARDLIEKTARSINRLCKNLNQSTMCVPCRGNYRGKDISI